MRRDLTVDLSTLVGTLASLSRFHHSSRFVRQLAPLHFARKIAKYTKKKISEKFWGGASWGDRHSWAEVPLYPKCCRWLYRSLWVCVFGYNWCLCALWNYLFHLWWLMVSKLQDRRRLCIPEIQGCVCIC